MKLIDMFVARNSWPVDDSLQNSEITFQICQTTTLFASCSQFGRKLISSFVARILLEIHDPRPIFSPKWKTSKFREQQLNLYFISLNRLLWWNWNETYLVVQMNFQILLSVPAKCKVRKANKITANVWSYQVCIH